MTLIEALTYLKDFSSSLKQIIEEIDYKGYDQLIKTHCRTIASQMTNISVCVMKKSPIYPYTNMIHARMENMIQNSDLTATFFERGIGLLNITQASTWYDDNIDQIDQYTDEIYELLNQNYEQFNFISDYLLEEYNKKYR